MRLADGRVARQTSLAPYSPPGDAALFATARRALEERLRGALVLAPSPTPAEDRWGRISGHLHARGELVGVWLAQAGLARVAPAAGDPCGRILLDAEAKARHAKLGLWANPYYSVLAADDAVALSSRSGEFVLVEGRISRLGQTSARFYLDFGPVRGVDLSVTISKQAAKAFPGAGLRLEALPGRRVRVRGTLDLRSWPSIDVSSPYAIETIGR